MQVHGDGEQLPVVLADTGIIEFGHTFWHDLWPDLATAIADGLGPAQAFHAQHPGLGVEVVEQPLEGNLLLPALQALDSAPIALPHWALPNAAPGPANQDVPVAASFLELAATLATLLDAHPEADHDTIAAMAYLAWLAAHPGFFPGPLDADDVISLLPQVAALLAIAMQEPGAVQIPVAELQAALLQANAGTLDPQQVITFVARLMRTDRASMVRRFETHFGPLR